VEEEADRPSDGTLAQLLAQENQVIVVPPDKVARFEQWGEALGERRVDLAIRGESRFVEGGKICPAVEERPERAVGEALVVAPVLRCREIGGRQREGIRLREFDRFVSILADAAAPAEPETTGLLERRP
jgi:hypothetical protein